MTAVGKVYNPVSEDQERWANARGRAPCFPARFVAGLKGQASPAEPLRKQAAQVGRDRADRWIALARSPAAGWRTC